MRFMRVLVVALVVLSLLSATPAAQMPSANDLARQIQVHYDTVRDFQAEFIQRHRGPFLPQTVVERGRLIVKKPGRLRMTYTRPKKEFVSNGTTFYAHFIEDKYGTETPLPKAGDASLALLFLAGRGSLVTDFAASLPTSQPDGKWQVILKPKAPQADFDTLTLTVERGSLKLVTLVTDDADSGTSTFEFSNLRENTGVADATFAFSFPKGTRTEISR